MQNGSMGSKKKLVLASLVSIMMVFAFAMTVGPAHVEGTASPAAFVSQVMVASSVAAADKVYAINSFEITNPANGSVVVVDSGAGAVPLLMTSTLDAPGATTTSVDYTYDGDIVVSSDVAPSYPANIPDVTALTSFTINAVANATAKYTAQDQVTFGVDSVEGDTSGNGLPNDPFGLGLEPGDVYYNSTSGEEGSQQTAVASLSGPTKSTIVDVIAVSVVDPEDASRTVTVEVPVALIDPSENALLVLTVADTRSQLFGDQDSQVGPDPADGLVGGGRYAEVTILIEDDDPKGDFAGYSPIDNSRLEANPLTLIMTGLDILTDGEGRFFTYPTTVADSDQGAKIFSDGLTFWDTLPNGTTVGDGVMVASLTHLSSFAPFGTPDAISITAVENTETGSASGFAIGGDTVRITVVNVDEADELAFTIDGNAAPLVTVKNGQFDVTTPRADKLDEPAASAAVDVGVEIIAGTKGDVTSDVLAGGFTYLGPEIDSVMPDAGEETGGDVVMIFGKGFDSSMAAKLGAAALVNAATNYPEKFTGTTTSHEPGRVGASVLTANNYRGTKSGVFTYLPMAPVLTSIFPSSSFTDGNYQMNLTGMGFVPPTTVFKSTGENQVLFTEGDVNPDTNTQANDVEFIDDSHLLALTPSFPEGEADVYAATRIPGNEKFETVVRTSNTLPHTFVDPDNTSMAITNINPGMGPLAGGNDVDIEGTGFPEGFTAVDKTSGIVLRIGENAAAQPLFGANSTEVKIPIYLFRGADVTDDNDTPIGLEGTIEYDPSVLDPVLTTGSNVAFTENPNLDDWYGKGLQVGTPAAGRVRIVVFGLNQTPITTINPGNAAEQENPFLIGSICFNVIGTAKGTNGDSTALNLTSVLMTDPSNIELDNVDTQDGFFTVGAEQGEIPATPIEVYIGAKIATITSLVSAKNGYSTATVDAPAGSRLGGVDVRVNDIADPTNFAISQASAASKAYGGYNISVVGGYQYNGELGVSSITPSRSWLFGGVIAKLTGMGFRYYGDLRSQVFINGVYAPIAPLDLIHSTYDCLYVIVPPLSGFGEDNDDKSADVDVEVINPTDDPKAFPVGESVVLQDAFTYFRFDERTEVAPGAEGDVLWTSFWYDPTGKGNGDESIDIVLDADEPLDGDIATLLIPAGAVDDGGELVYGIARATKTLALFEEAGPKAFTAGNGIDEIWHFDLHLYDGALPFAEKSVDISSNETPMVLTFPTDDADLTLGDMLTGGVSMFSLPSDLDYDPFADPAYSPSQASASFDSNIGPNEFSPNDLTAAVGTQVDEVAARLFSLSAKSLRTDFASPVVGAMLAVDAEGEGPVSGGTEVDVEGAGLGWVLIHFIQGNGTKGTGVAALAAQIQETVTDQSLTVVSPQAPVGEGLADIRFTFPPVDGDDAKGGSGDRIVTLEEAFLYVDTGHNLPIGLLLGLLIALLALLAGGDSGDGSSCFIATAAYGTPLAGDINTLRELRDGYMLTNPVGIAFVDLYYRISPPVADLVANNPLLAAAVRVALLPVIYVARIFMAMPQLSIGVLAVMGAWIISRSRKASRKA